MNKGIEVQEKKTQIDARHFWCSDCSHYFSSADFHVNHRQHELINLTPIGSCWASCPLCKKKVIDVPHYYAQLEKMHDNPTGPTTPEGKKRSSLNGFKHGLNCSQTRLLAPAKFDKYPVCESCNIRDKCENKEIRYCPNNLELMLKAITAYENGSVEFIKEYAGYFAGKQIIALDTIYYELFNKGALLEEVDKEGNKIYKRNPLLSVIPDMMKIGGFTADQQKMTPAAGNDDGGLEGHLKIKVSGDDFIAELKNVLSNVAGNVSDADKQREQDKVLKQLNNPEEIDENDTMAEMPSINPFERRQ